MSEAEEKPKLIIDEDWKTQVEREREKLRQESAGTSSTSANAEPTASTDTQPAEATAEPPTSRKQQAEPQLPPASFITLVSLLGSEALAALGQLGGGDQSQPEVRLDHAKHFIDLLGVLEDKTKGNLSSEESELIGGWLHQLRMGYVAMASRK